METVLVAGVFGGLVAVIVVCLVIDDRRGRALVEQQESQRAAEEEERERVDAQRKVEARRAQSARKKVYDAFVAYLQNPANARAILSGGLTVFPEAKTAYAYAQDAGVPLPAVVRRRIFGLFQRVHGTPDAPPEAVAVVAGAIAASAGDGLSEELGKVVRWAQRSCPEVVAAAFEVLEAIRKEDVDWYWETGDTSRATAVRRVTDAIGILRSYTAG